MHAQFDFEFLSVVFAAKTEAVMVMDLWCMSLVLLVIVFGAGPLASSP